eukprot:9475820-Pyramimonas_sp.AAC.2
MSGPPGALGTRRRGAPPQAADVGAPQAADVESAPVSRAPDSVASGYLAVIFKPAKERDLT